jgi:hypothetical protein
VAEWLRNGLQNRVHQFNSGRGLQPIPLILKYYSKPIDSKLVLSGLIATGFATIASALAVPSRLPSANAAGASCIPGMTGARFA